MKNCVNSLRILATLLVMLVAASGFAQDNFRETVKESYALFSQDYLESMRQACKQGCPFWFKSGELDLNKLTDRYVEEDLLDFMIDFILPKMKEVGVSEERMKETMSLLSTPEGRTFHEHAQLWSKEAKEELESILRKNDTSITNGGTIEPVQLKPGIDAEYVEKFKQFIDNQTINRYVSNFDTYSNSIIRFTEKLGVDISDKLENLKAWMIANVPTIALNSAYGILTTDDIDFAAANKIYNDDSTYNKFQDIFNSNDPIAFGLDIMTNYLEWMQNHGAVLQDGVMDLINKMKVTFGE